MPIEPGTCPDCEERKNIMPRAGVCRQCYGKAYYKQHKEKYQEYYARLSAKPEPEAEPAE
jgi:hypothetical protein